MPRFGQNMINLQIYGENYHGYTDTPTYALVKDLRSSIATHMNEDDEDNLELTLKGKVLPPDSTLAEVGVQDGSRIEVNKLTGEEKNERVKYKKSKKRKGTYNQLSVWSSDESCEGSLSAGGIRIDKVVQFREGKNLKLRDKLEKKFNNEVSTIDFILQALKMHQRTTYKRMCRMGFAFTLSMLIFAFGYVFFWWMYETGANLRGLTVRLEEAVEYISDLDPPHITLYTRTQTEIYSALPTWAKGYWQTQPEDTDFIGEMSYDDMLVHYESFKLGYQPTLTIVTEDDTRIRLYLYLCRENKADLDLYCFVGTMFASIELHCTESDDADENVCILTGPLDAIS